MPDRRARVRSRELTSPMAIVTSSGGPLYQLKVRDLSDQGAGIIVRPDSHLLQMIEVGTEVNLRLVMPKGTESKLPCSNYRSRVAHITEIKDGPFNGHIAVGLFFLARI